jgi:hypothetical protein
MTKKYRIDDIKPSELFLDSLSGYGIGSTELTCGYCGRLHLCPDAEYYSAGGNAEEGDPHRLYCQEEYEKNTEGVVLHYNCDGVSGHEMNGILFVITCPCNGLGKYENFIWDSKDTIRNYLKVRIEQEHRWADEQLTLNKLAGI